MALAWLTAAIGGAITATVVDLLGKALGAPHERQLEPATYIPLVVIGTLAGVIGWFLIGRRAAHPRTLLQRLVPVVLVLTFIPDILLGVSGVAWGAVITLMVMHLAVAAAALPAYAYFLPPSGR